MSKIFKNSFIRYLEDLKVRDDKAALAILRRGLSAEEKNVINMYPYVLKWARFSRNEWEKQLYFYLASLFAYHPLSMDVGNMGDTMFEIYKHRNESESIERRFMKLLQSNLDELLYRVRQAISLAKSESVPINWQQLFTDLKKWPLNLEKPPHEFWGNAFWIKISQLEKNEKIGGKNT